MSLEKIASCAVGGIFQGIAATSVIRGQIPGFKKRDCIKLILLMSIYGILSLLFVDNQLRFVLFLIVCTIFLNRIFKIRDRKVIIYAFNTEMLLSVSEIVISLILVVLGFNSVNIVNNAMLNLVANIGTSLLCIILSNLKLTKKALNQMLSAFDKNKKLIYYFYILILVVYLIVSKNGLEFVLKSNYYVNILFIISVVIVLTIFIKNELKYEQLNEKNKQMLNYVTKYEKIITEQGKANHEFKNQLMVIRGYAQKNSPKLIEYIDTIVDDIRKTHSSYLISNLNKFPDGGIKGLLYYKLSVMDDEKIKYDISVEGIVKQKLNNLSISEYKNITKILGVLLDNAIDASRKSKNKKIMIIVSYESKMIDFKIFNSYKNKIEISKIGTGYTTKGAGHGFGLKLVEDIVNSNSDFSTEHYLEDDYYVSVLHIKVSSKTHKK